MFSLPLVAPGGIDSGRLPRLPLSFASAWIALWTRQDEEGEDTRFPPLFLTIGKDWGSFQELFHPYLSRYPYAHSAMAYPL